MALYDDAKIIFLGSAAAGQERKDASKVYNVKPAPVISSTTAQDLSTYTIGGVTNAANSISVSGGVATFAGDGTEFTVLIKDLVFENSKNYRVDITVEITTGAVKFQDGDTSENIGVATVSGKYAFYFTSGSGSDDRKFRISRRSPDTAFNFTVSDVSVSEVNALPADFDISRDANLDATRVGPTGLIEKGRENLILQSNSFTTTWTSISASITGGQAGYDGSNNAWELKATGDGSTNLARLNQTSLSVSNVSTFSVYVKAGNTDFVRINLLTSGSPNCNNYFDLANGSVGSSPSGSVAHSSITAAGNGFYRIALTYDGSAGNITEVRIQVADADGDDIPATGSFIYIQDSQLEAGLVATDVITTGVFTATAGIKEDEPRFDYPVAGGPPALLIEPLRKNEVPNSEGVVENTNDVTLTVNYGIAPDGTKSSLKVAKGGADANDRIQPISNDNVTLTNSTDYSISAFVKNIDCTGVTTLACRTDAGSSELFRQGFQWTGASLALTSDQASGTRTGAFVESYGNDWWRIGFTFTANSTAGDFELDIDRANPTATTSIETWGWQLEKETNGGMVTSYIPCHGAAATRSADTLPEVTHGITLGTAVTVLLEARLFGGGGQVSFLQLRVDDDNRFLFFSNGSSLDSTHDINVQHRESNNNNAIQKTGLTRGDIFKCIGRVDGTTFNVFVNGVKLGTTHTLGAATDIYDKISFIRNGNTTNQSGHKNKSVVVWASALTDQQCRDLTTL
tara:strand:- start:454 stop:2679 length:2226 start_codon:yes stop_codon:yes gene_type:complete